MGCSGGRTSSVQSGNSSLLVFTAGALASWLNNKGAGWAYLVAPLLGTLTFDLPTFCAADQPALPTISATDVFNWFNPLNPTGAADLRTVMTQLVGALLWTDVCKCDSGAQNPPETAPQLTGININPGNGPQTNVPPCWDTTNVIRPVGNSAIFENPASNEPPANSAWMHSQWCSVTFTVNTDGTTNGDMLCSVNQLGHSNAALGFMVQNHDAAPGANFTVTAQLPVNCEAIDVTVQGTNASQNNTCGVHVQIWCNGNLPSNPASQCCPPDPVVSGMLSQLLALTGLIYSSLPVPLTSFSEGTAHSGLTGSGNFLTSASTIALKVAYTIGPGQGVIIGDPNQNFQVGWVTTSAAEGNYVPTRLVVSPQIIILSALVDQVHYTLEPGVSATITELSRGP